MTTQTLKQALMLITTRKSDSLRRAVCALNGKPEGGWPETRQAWGQMVGDLPARSLRAYTAEEFFDAVYELRNGRWYTKPEVLR